MFLLGFVTLPENFWVGAVGSVVFGVIGILLLLVGFKLFDWLLPKVDLQKKLDENPIAAAIAVGAFFLAVGQVIASVVH